MKTMSAREAKNGFGLMIDTAHAESVLIEKHRPSVTVVVAMEKYRRLNDATNAGPTQSDSTIYAGFDVGTRQSRGIEKVILDIKGVRVSRVDKRLHLAFDVVPENRAHLDFLRLTDCGNQNNNRL